MDQEPIEKISEISPSKRRKIWENAIQPVIPFLYIPEWKGTLISQTARDQCLSLITKSATQVQAKTLENDRQNREEKRQWARDDRKRDFHRRIHRQNENQNNFLKRKIDQISSF